VRSLKSPEALLALAFHPEGRFLIAASEQSPLLLWNLDSGFGYPTNVDRHAKPLVAAAFGPDGALAASTSGATLHLWQIRA
jgi:WD40 repeat protein